MTPTWRIKNSHVGIHKSPRGYSFESRLIGRLIVVRCSYEAVRTTRQIAPSERSLASLTTWGSHL